MMQTEVCDKWYWKTKADDSQPHVETWNVIYRLYGYDTMYVVNPYVWKWKSDSIFVSTDDNKKCFYTM